MYHALEAWTWLRVLSSSKNLGIRLMVGQQTLDLYVRVRLLHPQPGALCGASRMASSTSGLGRSPLKAETGVRIPLGLPVFTRLRAVAQAMMA